MKNLKTLARSELVRTARDEAKRFGRLFLKHLKEVRREKREKSE